MSQDLLSHYNDDKLKIKIKIGETVIPIHSINSNQEIIYIEV